MPTPHDQTNPIPESVEENVDKDIDDGTENDAGIETNSEVLMRLRVIGKLIIPPAAN